MNEYMHVYPARAAVSDLCPVDSLSNDDEVTSGLL